MPKSKNSFEIHNSDIFISRPEWDAMALATYREDYFEELTSHTWSLQNGYPSNATLGGGLHRYMMSKWYGADVLADMTEKGYVVDHMNNNHMDCRITNLEFLKNNRNVAKGQYFDKESEVMRHKLAVSIFKDFNTGCYQITIGCNDTIGLEDPDGHHHLINSIKLLYNCGYPNVVLDAEAILTQYDEEQSFSLQHMRCCDIKIYEAPAIELTDEEKKQAFVIRDGVPYLIIGNGKNFLDSVHYEENWIPPRNES